MFCYLEHFTLLAIIKDPKDLHWKIQENLNEHKRTILPADAVMTSSYITQSLKKTPLYTWVNQREKSNSRWFLLQK